MAETLPDIGLTSTWVNINVESDIPVGTPFTIHSKSSQSASFYESETQPQADSKDGIVLQGFEQDHVRIDVLQGSLAIWAKSALPRTESRINVQVL